jgi:hypothetical protein
MKDAKDHEGRDAKSAVLDAFVSIVPFVPIVAFVPIVFNHYIKATLVQVRVPSRLAQRVRASKISR